MLIANISRNIVQEARKFISDTQARSVRSRQNRPQNNPNEDTSVATEQGVDTTRLVPVDATRQMQVESNLREARDWANEFYGARRTAGQFPASSMVGKPINAALTISGDLRIFTVTSVITPSKPSDPVIKPKKS